MSWQVVFKQGPNKIVVATNLPKDHATKMAVILNVTLKFVKSPLRCLVIKQKN